MQAATRWRIPIACAALALVGPAMSASAAWADEPRAGKRYDGKSATGQHVHLRVARSGERLGSYAFVVRTVCSDGRRRFQGLNHRNEAPSRIRDGRFSFTSRWGRLGYRVRGASHVRGRARFRFEGEFEAAGDRVRGTLSAVFRSRRFRCESGPVAFRAHRDGTRGAPYRSRNVATGRYTIHGEDIWGGYLRSFLPGRLVRKFFFDFVARCGSGKVLQGRYTLWAPMRANRFGDSGVFRSRLKNGDRLVERWGFRGRFWNRGSYGVSGRITIRARLFRNGRLIDRCRLRHNRFAGTFQGGPVNIGADDNPP